MDAAVLVEAPVGVGVSTGARVGAGVLADSRRMTYGSLFLLEGGEKGGHPV